MQMTFYQSEAGKCTKRKKFYEEIQAFLPITEWIDLILPYYRKKSDTCRPRRQLEILLRVFLVKMFFGLSYEKAEDELYESISARNFCGVNTDSEIPDATSIFRFETMLTKKRFARADV